MFELKERHPTIKFDWKHMRGAGFRATLRIYARILTVGLQGLVIRANNGTFEAVQAAGATKQTKPLITLLAGIQSINTSKPETATGFIQQARAALRGAI
jgi:acylphosphatase